MIDICVIYHKNCLDGYGAAWAAHELFGEEADYIPANPGQSPPEIQEGVTLYTVDIAYPPEELDKLSELCKRVVIIDHHKTAADWYNGYTPPENVELNIDMDRSGAVMAWQYFHREKKVPELLLYIQDRDLWQWLLPDSEAILLAVDAYPYTFSNMDKLMNDMSRLKTEGQAILKYRNQMLDLQLESSHFVQFDLDDKSYVIPAVNCSLRALVSESCQELLRKFPEAPFVTAYRRGASGAWDYSLRSNDAFDVADFATKYAGGGGHSQAAGMSTPKPPKVITGDKDATS